VDLLLVSIFARLASLCPSSAPSAIALRIASDRPLFFPLEVVERGDEAGCLTSSPFDAVVADRLVDGVVGLVKNDAISFDAILNDLLSI
jgi:hypothetical protein